MSFLRPTILKITIFLGFFVLPWSVVEVLPGMGLPVDPAIVGGMEAISPAWRGAASLPERGLSLAGADSLAGGPVSVALAFAAWYLASALAGSVVLFLLRLYLAVFRWQG